MSNSTKSVSEKTPQNLHSIAEDQPITQGGNPSPAALKAIETTKMHLTSAMSPTSDSDDQSGKSFSIVSDIGDEPFSPADLGTPRHGAMSPSFFEEPTRSMSRSSTVSDGSLSPTMFSSRPTSPSQLMKPIPQSLPRPSEVHVYVPMDDNEQYDMDAADWSNAQKHIFKLRNDVRYPRNLDAHEPSAMAKAKDLDRIYAVQVKSHFKNVKDNAKKAMIMKLLPHSEWNLLVPQHDLNAMAKFLIGADYADYSKVLNAMDNLLKNVQDLKKELNDLKAKLKNGELTPSQFERFKNKLIKHPDKYLAVELKELIHFKKITDLSKLANLADSDLDQIFEKKFNKFYQAFPDSSPQFDQFYARLTEVMSKLSERDLQSFRTGEMTPHAQEFWNLHVMLDQNGFPNVRGRQLHLWTGIDAREKAFIEKEGPSEAELSALINAPKPLTYDVVARILDKKFFPTESLKFPQIQRELRKVVPKLSNFDLKSISNEDPTPMARLFLQLIGKEAVTDSKVGTMSVLMAINSQIFKEDAESDFAQFMSVAASTVLASQGTGEVFFYFSNNKKTEKFERAIQVGNAFTDGELPTVQNLKFSGTVSKIWNVSQNHETGGWRPRVSINDPSVYLARRDSHPLDSAEERRAHYNSVPLDWNGNFPNFQKYSPARKHSISSGQLDKDIVSPWRQRAHSRQSDSGRSTPIAASPAAKASPSSRVSSPRMPSVVSDVTERRRTLSSVNQPAATPSAEKTAAVVEKSQVLKGRAKFFATANSLTYLIRKNKRK